MSAGDSGDPSEHMGVCDLCGFQINISEGDKLNVIDISEDELPDGFTRQDVAESMAEALRFGDAKYDELASLAYEKFQGIKAHERCLDETSIPEWLEEPEQIDEWSELEE